MPLSDDVGQWLETLGIGILAPITGTIPGADIFTEQLGDTAPDAAILVTRGPGLAPFKVIDTPVSAWEKPGAQVIVRGSPRDQRIVEARAESVRDAIDKMHGQTINGSRYMKVERAGDISFLEEDDRFRRKYSMNFVLWQVTAA